MTSHRVWGNPYDDLKLASLKMGKLQWHERIKPVGRLGNTLRSTRKL